MLAIQMNIWDLDLTFIAIFATILLVKMRLLGILFQEAEPYRFLFNTHSTIPLHISFAPLSYKATLEERVLHLPIAQ